MNDLVWTRFVANRGVARREVCKLEVLHVTSYDVLGSQMTIVKRKRRFKRMFLVRDPVTSEVDPFVLVQLRGDPYDNGIRSLDVYKCAERGDALRYTG